MKKISINKLVGGLATLALLLAGSLFSAQTTTAAGLPTVRIISPTFEAANETFASDGLGQYYAAGGRSYFKYVGAGSTITLSYLVTTDGTAPAVGKNVTFLVNAPWSGSKATWEVNGKAVGPSVEGNAGLAVTGKTDSAGKVSFTIKSTNTTDSAMAIPASETQPRATSDRLFGNMKLVIDGLTDMQQAIDLVTFDITKATATVLAPPTTKPVAKKTTITCVKGKLVKKVTAVNPKCPTGYKKK